ncbi:MAG: HupE/UreJ family protein [Bacteroidia bacterium]
MSDFQLYLKLGFEHISDLNGYDHILFLIALCATYQYQEWKKVLILVTAFTIGHSITLALSTLQIVSINTALIEFLIPVTILITCVFNYLQRDDLQKDKPMTTRYLVALFFGLIHGLGFSNYLKSLLGKDESIVFQLFSFNVGLELGQLVIVLFILLVSWFLTVFSNMKKEIGCYCFRAQQAEFL